MATVSEGTIRVHRSIGGNQCGLPRRVRSYGEGDDASLRVSVRSSTSGSSRFPEGPRHRADYIKDVLRPVDCWAFRVVPNVSISEKVLRTAGFVSIGNLARATKFGIPATLGANLKGAQSSQRRMVHGL